MLSRRTPTKFPMFTEVTKKGVVTMSLINPRTFELGNISASDVVHVISVEADTLQRLCARVGFVLRFCVPCCSTSHTHGMVYLFVVRQRVVL
jgi:hypothetical protein